MPSWRGCGSCHTWHSRLNCAFLGDIKISYGMHFIMGNPSAALDPVNQRPVTGVVGVIWMNAHVVLGSRGMLPGYLGALALLTREHVPGYLGVASWLLGGRSAGSPHRRSPDPGRPGVDRVNVLFYTPFTPAFGLSRWQRGIFMAPRGFAAAVFQSRWDPADPTLILFHHQEQFALSTPIARILPPSSSHFPWRHQGPSPPDNSAPQGNTFFSNFTLSFIFALGLLDR